jgi:hypothetical protein
MRYIKKINEAEDAIERDFNILQNKVDSLFRWNKFDNYRVTLYLQYSPSLGFILKYSIASLGSVPVSKLEDFSLATEKALLLINAFCRAHPEVVVK